MAKNERNNKNLAVGICSALVVLVVVIMVVVLAVNGTKGLDDSYFVSDDSKYVLTVDSDMIEASEDEEEYVPVKTHYVYTVADDKITGLKTYYEYNNGDDAKAAFDFLKSKDDSINIELNGKYVILTAPESEYEDDTPSDVKQRFEFINMMQSGNYPGAEEAETVNGGETVESVEVVEENTSAETAE